MSGKISSNNYTQPVSVQTPPAVVPAHIQPGVVRPTSVLIDRERTYEAKVELMQIAYQVKKISKESKPTNLKIVDQKTVDRVKNFQLTLLEMNRQPNKNNLSIMMDIYLSRLSDSATIERTRKDLTAEIKRLYPT